MKTLTIFTPTYNRDYALPKLYESLTKQTSNDFEWLIVDDGSTDNTAELVEGWKRENKIPILFYKQQNGGKMRAHNKGVERCRTELFVCIDSDDCIVATGVEKIVRCWMNVKNKSSISGIIAYKAIKNKYGEYTVKKRFASMDNSTLGKLYETGFVGDTTLVFASNVIRCFPFPEVEGEKFITEAYSYDQIDQEYMYVLLDSVITLCEYLPDGYTQNEKVLFKKYPKGWALFFNQRAKFTYKYISKKKIIYGMYYMIFARKAKKKNIYKESELKTPLYPFVWLLSYLYEKRFFE